MERYDKILGDINIPTYDLKIITIQDILKLSKVKSVPDKEYWNKLSDILWIHLKNGLRIFDDQLLSATCFYTVITHTDKQDFYLTELLQLIDEELNKKKNEQISTKTFQVVSLMYGIFQSTFLIQKTYSDVPKIASVLKPITDLLLILGYEYSQYTYISFKTMKLFDKVCGTELEEYIFNEENQIRILTFVNHNWENPITGIRDLNRSIFQILISTLDDNIYEVVLKEINTFYWNKAKYLMLSEIIEHQNGNLLPLIHDNKWVDGLIYSLYKPGLVSAGADMYYALLKQINFVNDWCKLFLGQITKVLNGSSFKAIENFNNFWCLITLKKFSELFSIIISELEKTEETEQNLCSKLCIIKQANKLDIIENSWSSIAELSQIEKIVMKGMTHCNYYIRMSAFDVVCVSHKFVPSELKYDLVIDFLYNNVNSDCTVLRLSMLNSFNIFLTQLHSMFLNVMIKHRNSEDLQHLLGFCRRLQECIINSINLNGNYQRKITCVKLCISLISCLSEIPKKKKGQARQGQIALIGYVKENGCWLLSMEQFVVKLVTLLKDPTNDVREHVINLLLNHYTKELKEPNIIKHLVNDALKCINSKFFYEISCGQSMFKLLTNLVMKYDHSIPEYRSVEDILNFAYSTLITENESKTNIMKSIETGKQLHSFMSILLVILETCISSSYKIDINSKMPEFVNALESIANQFSWEEDSTSSDFSKMNEMVENIIVTSGYQLAEENDEAKISGLHQIVMNCLWLNVKASCDLASILIQFNVNEASTCDKCLNIITHVLETSRHKGAIEAAGAALGRGIQFLTSLPEDNIAAEVPFELLRCKLDELISETNRLSSITRRGAGLSIMVHRIVSSDMKKGKPLFHYFINTLLQVCYTNEGTLLKTSDENIENQIDLPKAIYIHFMTRIVTDSSLASDMMFYVTKLAELAFNNLTSPHWQIRNAALQLYGALIPKLIGEKKASGSDEETTATVACDELRTHSPKLWKYITEQLKCSKGIDTLQSYFNFVPILNLLANSAKRYNFSHELLKQKSEDDQLFLHLLFLLNSPIHTVRRLTAKCIFNIYDFEKIHEALLHPYFLMENYLHGSLILLNLCHEYYALNPYHEEKIKQLRDRFSGEIFTQRNRSYICKRLLEVLYTGDIQLKDIERTISELKSNVHLPGVHLWAQVRIEKYINTCSWDEIPGLLHILLQQRDCEHYCKLLSFKMEQDCKSKQVLLEVAEILLSSKNYSSSIIWKILYEISLKINLSNHLDTAELLQTVSRKESTYILRYIIPLVARNIASSQEETHLSLMKIITKMSDFENSDVDMRYIAAIANNELANEFDKLSNSVKVISIKCAVMLLQDEDEEIRNLSVYFYARLREQQAAVQPYICLRKILNREFLFNIFAECQSSVQELVRELSAILQLNHTKDQYNPFGNDSKNVYLEPDVLKQMIANL